LKTYPIALADHLAQPTTTLANLLEITRRDGVVFRFTDHDQPITYGGVVFYASAGFSATAIKTTAGLNVDEMEIDGYFDDATITEADLLAGRWDGAKVLVMIVNWAEPSQGVAIRRYGSLGEVTTDGSGFKAEMRGLMQSLQQTTGEVVSATCRAEFGDTRCKVSLQANSYVAAVTAVTSKREFVTNVGQPSNYFNDGHLVFTSGLNVGVKAEIKSFALGVVLTYLKLPFDIQVGDNLTLTRGCNKTIDQGENNCASYFNVINFRGEPFKPTSDEQIKGVE
jgi:uncharacterized phage protein (TIGR02218 family)